MHLYRSHSLRGLRFIQLAQQPLRGGTVAVSASMKSVVARGRAFQARLFLAEKARPGDWQKLFEQQDVNGMIWSDCRWPTLAAGSLSCS